MEMNGISVTSFEGNQGGIYLQQAGVFLLAQKDWLRVTRLSS